MPRVEVSESSASPVHACALGMRLYWKMGMTEKKTIVSKARNLKKALGPFADLGPPPDVPSVDEVHVLYRTFAKPLHGQVVEPEDGYDAHSPHGLLSSGPGPSNRLLCLADVFEWMRGKELPRKAVVNAVLAPLVQLDEADGGYRRQELYVVNGEDYAYPLSIGERLNPKARVVWDELDFAYHNTYSMGVVREIADLWDASWPGYVKDPSQFYQDGWIRYCKVMKSLALSSHGPGCWEEEYRDRYCMSLDEWKDRCKRAVRFLSLIAVPLSVAHELWGWGSVADAVESTSPVATAAERPTTSQELDALLTEAMHADQLAAAANGRKIVLTPRKWTFEMRQIISAKLEALVANGRGQQRSEACEWLALCLGVTRPAIVQQMSKLASEIVEMERENVKNAAAKSNAFSGGR